MMKCSFQPFPELETGRLLLRKLSVDDAPLLFFLRSDEAVMQFIDRPRAGSIEEVEEFIKKVNTDIDAGNNILWAITLKEEPHKLIGTICYWQIDRDNYRAETGYVLHPDYWRKGIMKEALLKVIDFGFKDLKLHSIQARVNPANLPSSAILEATGFKKEGYFREDYLFNGKWLDTAIYSLLSSDSF